MVHFIHQIIVKVTGRKIKSIIHSRNSNSFQNIRVTLKTARTNSILSVQQNKTYCTTETKKKWAEKISFVCFRKILQAWYEYTTTSTAPQKFQICRY